MAAGTLTIREVDFSPRALADWQCLKAPVTAAETALTAAKLYNTTMHSVVPADDNNYQVIPVNFFDAIRVQVLGNGSDTHAPVLSLFGWTDYGPGQYIGVVTTALSTMTSLANTGWHANSYAHKSIRDAFAAGTAWRAADTYTITSDYELEMWQDADTAKTVQHRTLTSPVTNGSPPASPPVADFASYFTVDFSRSQYRFFGVAVTNLGSATSAGAIFRPVRLKGGLTTPTGV